LPFFLALSSGKYFLLQLKILSATLRGCSDEVLGEQLTDIVALLVDPDVCQTSEKVNPIQSAHVSLALWTLFSSWTFKSFSAHGPFN